MNRSAFSLGQLVAAGLLAEAEVTRELSAAATDSGLREREIGQAIRRGLTAGKRYPRQVPGGFTRLSPARLSDAITAPRPGTELLPWQEEPVSWSSHHRREERRQRIRSGERHRW